MSDLVEGLDQAINEMLAAKVDCNWWIIKICDPSKRKNAKPVSITWWQGSGSLASFVIELLQNPPDNIDALESMTIEARRMTQAEIDKWDRLARARDRRRT